MKQLHLTKETAKVRIRFSTLFENEDFAPKSSRFRERKKHKNETGTGYKRCEIVIKNFADTADQVHPRIDSKTSSFIENFTHVPAIIVDKQRCSCGPLRKQLLVTGLEAEREQRKAF